MFFDIYVIKLSCKTEKFLNLSLIEIFAV